MAEPDVFSIVLAGGRGTRLDPLSRDRAKPAVPFAGQYRLIDFALSNLVNAGLLKVAVLTQYKSHSLDRHIAQTWRLSPLLGQYVTPVPAQMRRGAQWFAGSADAVYQNFNLIHDEVPDYVLVFGADHIYRMDPRQMLEAHIASGAGMTIAGIRVPRSQANQFGVIECDADNRVTAFHEKPNDPPGLADSPDEVLASMGNYIFTASALLRVVNEDAKDERSGHDMGGDIVPRMVAADDAGVYDFTTNEIGGEPGRDPHYWRDVGTIDSYHAAHMDLISPVPEFNLYNTQWPIHTWNRPRPPAKFVVGEEGRAGHAVDSMVSPGSIVAGGEVRHSVLSPDVRVDSHALVERSVLLTDVTVGPGAVVRDAIVDKHVTIPEGGQLGVDRDRDARLRTVSPGGITVVGKGEKVQP